MLNTSSRAKPMEVTTELNFHRILFHERTTALATVSVASSTYIHIGICRAKKWINSSLLPNNQLSNDTNNDTASRSLGVENDFL